jgi:hypothetical protein
MFDKSLMQPGDILLFKVEKKSTFVEKLIALGQRFYRHVPKQVKYCHVALVDKDTDLMLEAVWPKTRVTKIDFAKIEQHENVELYRVRKITPEQIDQVINWAHDHLDEWYDVPLLLTGFLDSKHAEVCSTFVSHAERAAQLEIPSGCSNKKLIVPDDYYEDVIGLDKIA